MKKARITTTHYEDGARVAVDLDYRPDSASVRGGAVGTVSYCQLNTDRLQSLENGRFVLLHTGRDEPASSPEILTRTGETPVPWRWMARVDFPDGGTLLDTVFTSKPFFKEGADVRCANGFDLGARVSTQAHLVDYDGAEPSLHCMRGAHGFEVRVGPLPLKRN